MRLAAAAALLALPGADGWSSAHSPISAHALSAAMHFFSTPPPILLRLNAIAHRGGGHCAERVWNYNFRMMSCYFTARGFGLQ